MYLLPMIVSLLSMFSIATFWAMAGPSSKNQHDPAIIAEADGYLKAVLAGDARAVAAMFDDDAILMPPNQPALHGRLPIQHFYDRWFHSPMQPTAFTFDHLEATVTGDSAYDVGTYKISIAAGPGGNVDETGKYTAVLKRSAGEWKIAYLIFNSDLPPQPPVAAPAK